MKQKHLYSLLDQSYTTIGVIFPDRNNQSPVPPAASPAHAQELKRMRERGERLPWVTPQGAKTYTYKVPLDANIQDGDFVVVYRDTTGLNIGMVTRVDAAPQIDVDANYDYKWIVQRIDREAYQARVDAERVFADAMLNVERARQQEAMIRGFHENLPEGSEARRLFDQTVQKLAAPTVVQAPPPAGNTEAKPA